MTTTPLTNSTSPAPSDTDSKKLHTLIPLLAIAAGLSAANLYYNNPLLKLMAISFGVSEAAIGVIPVVMQMGYAIGMLLIVPLGDMLQRRKLIPALLGVVAVAEIVAANARNLTTLAIASLVVGIFTCVPQILLPFAAKISSPSQRGRALGTVLMGLLLGVLLSRTLSGQVGHYFGWRTMYVLAAVLVSCLAIALARLLPSHELSTRLTYGQLIRSVGHLIRTEPTLRQSMVNGGLIFGSFSAFWATLIFRLQTPPLHYGESAAGMFGLVGAAGALAAPHIGKLATHRGPRTLITLCSALMALCYGIFYVSGHTIIGLTIGVLVLDMAVQGAQVSNQTRIYSLSSHAHSRVNSAFMVSYFLGGASGSLLASKAWKIAQWNGVCAVGAGFAIVALITHLMSGRRPRSGENPKPEIQNPNQ